MNGAAGALRLPQALLAAASSETAGWFRSAGLRSSMKDAAIQLARSLASWLATTWGPPLDASTSGPRQANRRKGQVEGHADVLPGPTSSYQLGGILIKPRSSDFLKKKKHTHRLRYTKTEKHTKLSAVQFGVKIK